jgi:hypothetical protein
MLLDMHVVVSKSDDDAKLEVLVLKLLRQGFEGACFVGDCEIPPVEKINEMVSSRNIALKPFFGIKLNVGKGKIIFVPRDVATLNEDTMKKYLPTTSVDEVCDLCERVGGALVATHPYDRSGGATTFVDSIFAIQGIDAVEVANGSSHDSANRLALDACVRLRLTPVAGSGKIRGLDAIGRVATVFVEQLSGQEMLVDALEKGEAFVAEFRRPSLSSGARFGSSSRRSQPSQ